MAEDTRAWLTKSLTGLLGCTDDQIVDTATLRQLGADSLDPVEIAIAIEDRFSVDLGEDDVGIDTRVDQVLTLIDAKVAAR